MLFVTEAKVEADAYALFVQTVEFESKKYLNKIRKKVEIESF